MKRLSLILIPLAAAFLLGGVILAQSGGGYDMSWSTVDGGGAESSGGSYTIAGTAGQPDAGSVHSGGPYALVGGFWAATAVSVSPAVAVPGLTAWGLWALAGLLLVAVLARTLRGRRSALSTGATGGATGA